MSHLSNLLLTSSLTPRQRLTVIESDVEEYVSVLTQELSEFITHERANEIAKEVLVDGYLGHDLLCFDVFDHLPNHVFRKGDAYAEYIARVVVDKTLVIIGRTDDLVTKRA